MLPSSVYESQPKIHAASRLYATRAERDQLLEKLQDTKRAEDEEKFKSLHSFRPTDRPGSKTKGMKDTRQMFTQPKGVDGALKRIADGRATRAEIKEKTTLRPNLP